MNCFVLLIVRMFRYSYNNVPTWKTSLKYTAQSNEIHFAFKDEFKQLNKQDNNPKNSIHNDFYSAWR